MPRRDDLLVALRTFSRMRRLWPTSMYWLGGPAGNRTLDTKIKSLVLYQLSYRPAAAPPSLAAPLWSNQVFSSAARRIFTILSGLLTLPLLPAPFLIWSTNSMPATTWPQMVYWPSRNGAGARQM